MPRPIDCKRTAPPRRIGNLRIGALSLHLGNGAAVFTIVPSALRTAIAYAFGVRIMTPSMTAWPPTIKSRSLVLMVLNDGTHGAYGTIRHMHHRSHQSHSPHMSHGAFTVALLITTMPANRSGRVL